MSGVNWWSCHQRPYTLPPAAAIVWSAAASMASAAPPADRQQLGLPGALLPPRQEDASRDCRLCSCIGICRAASVYLVGREKG